MADGVRRPLTVVVCTLNEEEVIGRCLASVAWADERLVVDSGSSDRTCAIATGTGARVEKQPWLGFSMQKNRAASLAQHDWILSLDADEVVTPELAQSIERVLADDGPDPGSGFSVNRRSDFLGALLPNGARRQRREAFVRLYNRRRGAWDEDMAVHEAVRVPGLCLALPGDLLHLSAMTIDDMVLNFNRYASVEARDLLERGRRTRPAEVLVRPVLRFAWQYLVIREFRLGGHGAVHAGLQAAREFLRYAKLWELQGSARWRRGKRGQPW